MAASSRAEVLRLYRALLRESQRFGGYNYRRKEQERDCPSLKKLVSVLDAALLLLAGESRGRVVPEEAGFPAKPRHHVLRPG